MSTYSTPSDDQPQSLTDMPSRPLSEDQVWRDLWTQPPQPLPGPDDHPFFKKFAPNAYGPLSQLDISLAMPSADANNDTSIISKASIFDMPLVYPFIPGPSISMEPMTPENERTTTSTENPVPSHSQRSTPSLIFSNDDHDSSPDSRPITAKSPKTTGLVGPDSAESEKDEITPPAATTPLNQKPVQEDPDEMEVDAACILTYMRAIPNSATAEPAVVANGQIWHSPDRKKGWRRNQWVVDVR